MSEHTQGTDAADTSDTGQKGDLQFDKAEYFEPAASTLMCGACKQAIGADYYQLNAMPICGSCQAPVSQVLARGAGAFGKAAGLGLGAAIFGALVYFAISAVTGYELGLVAILVGYLVGKAVRMGSGGRGGPRYQALAMALTYCSIAATYVPPILKGLAANDSTPSVPGVLFLALAAPFLVGAKNIMGLVIIGIGVYEAWKFTRAVPLSLTGPFQLAPNPAVQGDRDA